MPEKWETSKCYSCKWFVTYPVCNGSYEGWTWECDADAEESWQKHPLNQCDRCTSFYPKDAF